MFLIIIHLEKCLCVMLAIFCHSMTEIMQSTLQNEQLLLPDRQTNVVCTAMQNWDAHDAANTVIASTDIIVELSMLLLLLLLLLRSATLWLQQGALLVVECTSSQERRCHMSSVFLACQCLHCQLQPVKHFCLAQPRHTRLSSVGDELSERLPHDRLDLDGS